MDREAALEGKLVHLRLTLAHVLRELREASGLTQQDLAERRGVQQPAIAKLERAGDHKVESLLRHLDALGADLLVAVKHGDDAVQVSDDEERLLVALPREVDAWAAEQGLDLDTYVLETLRHAHEASRTSRSVVG